jgi:hypothetical protein
MTKHAEEALSAMTSRVRRMAKSKTPFASEHEMLGKLHEELMEIQQAIHARGTTRVKAAEVEDLAVACLWGMASYGAGMRQKRKNKKCK